MTTMLPSKIRKSPEAEDFQKEIPGSVPRINSRSKGELHQDKRDYEGGWTCQHQRDPFSHRGTGSQVDRRDRHPVHAGAPVHWRDTALRGGRVAVGASEIVVNERPDAIALPQIFSDSDLAAAVRRAKSYRGSG